MNAFDVDAVPTSTSSIGVYNNNDGTLTVKTGTNTTGVDVENASLIDLAPNLKAGETYVLTLVSTASTRKQIYLRATKTTWQSGTTLTITEDMLTSNSNPKTRPEEIIK